MDKPNYYAIIPAMIRYDENLKDKAKLLYGEIVALSDKNGKCWASNNYFAELYKISNETVSRLISSLIKNGYLESKIIYKDDTKRIDKRVLIPIDKNVNTYCQKNQLGIDKKVKENNTSINNTSINNISIVEQAIDYMNELAGTTFKATTKKTIQLINARLKEGFDIEDIKDVIYYKYNEWVVRKCVFKNGVSSDAYYRPNTLFSTNFEEYLQQYKKEYK